jgi:hypothetical protein
MTHSAGFTDYSDELQAPSSVSADNSSQSAIGPGSSRVKFLKSSIKSLTDVSAIKSFIRKHRDEINTIPTSTLNSWLRVPNYQFVKTYSVVGLRKKRVPIPLTDIKTLICDVLAAFKIVEDRLNYMTDELDGALTACDNDFAKTHLIAQHIKALPVQSRVIERGQIRRAA